MVIGTLDARMTLDTRQFKRSMQKIQKDTSKATKGIENSFNRIQGLLAGGVIAAGLEKLFDLGQAGENINNVRESFEELAAAINIDAVTAIETLQEATRGTVSELDLMLAANNALLLGVVETEEELGQLAEAATTLGIAVGRTATEAFNDLVTGIGRQSALILDNLGIIVKAKAAYEAYAKSVGKASSQLTDAEKKQAFANAAIESAISKAADLKDAQDDVNLTFQQASADAENFFNVLQEGIAKSGTASVVLGGFSSTIEGINADQVARLVDLITKMGIALGGIVVFNKALSSPTINKFFAKTGDGILGLQFASSGSKVLRKEAAILTKQMSALEKTAGITAKSMSRFKVALPGSALAAVRTKLVANAAEMKNLAELTKIAKGNIGKFGAELTASIAILAKFIGKILKVAIVFEAAIAAVKGFFTRWRRPRAKKSTVPGRSG